MSYPLNVQLKSSDTLKLNMAFPQASLATQLSTIQTSNSPNDRMDTLDAQRRTREYKAKGTNAKNRLYQFFQLVIQSQNQVQIASRPSKDTLDMLENLEKLRQAGILSETEFVAKKQEILSRL